MVRCLRTIGPTQFFLTGCFLVFSLPLRASQPDGPYQIETFTNEIVIVDLGARDPQPQTGRFQQMTILGTQGAEPAAFEGFEKLCVHLCGEDYPATCHFVARFRRAHVGSANQPVVAFAGTMEASDFHPFPMLEGASKSNPHDWISESYSKAIGGREFRWFREKEGGEVYLESSDMGRRFYSPPIALSTCTLKRQLSFLILSCRPLAELLYEGKDLLLASFADHSIAKAQILASFKMDGLDYYLAQLGNYFGLLWKEGGEWKSRWAAADYLGYAVDC